MLRDIIRMLNQDDWMVGDEDIDFAKGGSKVPETFKETKQLIRRHGRRK